MIYIKDYKQIDGIRKSGQLAAQTLNYIRNFIKSGVKTVELNDLVEKFIRDHGAIPACLGYRGFPKACCISVNEVICHGIPDDRVLKDGDILNVDVTTILDGYYGDTSTMFVVGDISEDAKKLLDVAYKCLEIGVHQVKPGNYLGNIGYEIGKYAKSQNCSVVTQYCGHGTGLEFHEDPQVSHIATQNSGIKLRPGMVFTIEPMINLGKAEVIINESDGWTASTIDGSLSAQFEHTVAVTRKGVEILTKA